MATSGNAASVAHPFREAELLRAHRRGREAWPGIDVDAQLFVEHVASKLEHGVELDALAVEDLYLACALLRGDPAALRVVEQRFIPQIAAVLARRGVAGDGIDELAQALREHLLVGTRTRPGRIVDYAGRGPLRSFIIVAAVRMSQRADQRARRRLNLVPVASIADTGEDEAEDALAKGEYREPVARACEHALLELPRRERALLRLQLVDGASIDQIGVIYGVHRATAARWLARARAMIRDGTSERLAHALGVDESRAASIADLVHSRIDVSVARLLRTSPS